MDKKQELIETIQKYIVKNRIRFEKSLRWDDNETSTHFMRGKSKGAINAYNHCLNLIKEIMED